MNAFAELVTANTRLILRTRERDDLRDALERAITDLERQEARADRAERRASVAEQRAGLLPRRGPFDLPPGSVD